VNEISFLENLPPLGDVNEPLLARALETISGEEAVAKAAPSLLSVQYEIFKDSRDLEQFGKEMYILPVELKESDF